MPSPSLRLSFERVSIAACSRILQALEQRVPGLTTSDVRALTALCRACIVDPSVLLRSMVLNAALELPILIQYLEPPIDHWSPNA